MNAPAPSVSVVLPTFNRAPLLREVVARALRFQAEDGHVEDCDFLFRLHVAGHVLRQNPTIAAHYRRISVPGSAPQMVSDVLAAQRAHLKLTVRHVDDASDPEAVRRLARRWAPSHIGEGDWAAARPHLLAWWRRKPGSMRVLLLYFRSLFARSGAG